MHKKGETEPRKPGRKHASVLDAREILIIDLIEVQKGAFSHKGAWAATEAGQAMFQV